MARAEPERGIYDELRADDSDYGDYSAADEPLAESEPAGWPLGPTKSTYSQGSVRAEASVGDEQPALGWHRIARLGALSEPGSATPLALTVGAVQQQQLVAQLHVDSLSSEDNGLYSCRVDFRKARSRTQESLLRIVGKWLVD